MLCLRYSQVKVSVELLPVGIIMRMHHLRIRRISHRVSCFHRLCRIDHIFIKYRMSDEPAQFLIDLPAIGRTDIGAEKSLDPQAVQVCCRFDPGLCRIVKFSGIALHRCRILSGQLSRIGHRHFPLQGFHQFFDQPVIFRHGILCHHHEDIRRRLFYSHPSRTAMIELSFGYMVYLDILIGFQKSDSVDQLFKIFFFRIQKNHLMYRYALTAQFIQ